MISFKQFLIEEDNLNQGKGVTSGYLENPNVTRRPQEFSGGGSSKIDMNDPEFWKKAYATVKDQISKRKSIPGQKPYEPADDEVYAELNSRYKNFELGKNETTENLLTTPKAKERAWNQLYGRELPTGLEHIRSLYVPTLVGVYNKEIEKKTENDEDSINSEGELIRRTHYKNSEDFVRPIAGKTPEIIAQAMSSDPFAAGPVDITQEDKLPYGYRTFDKVSGRNESKAEKDLHALYGVDVEKLTKAQKEILNAGGENAYHLILDLVREKQFKEGQKDNATAPKLHTVYTKEKENPLKMSGVSGGPAQTISWDPISAVKQLFKGKETQDKIEQLFDPVTHAIDMKRYYDLLLNKDPEALAGGLPVQTKFNEQNRLNALYRANKMLEMGKLSYRGKSANKENSGGLLWYDKDADALQSELENYIPSSAEMEEYVKSGKLPTWEDEIEKTSKAAMEEYRKRWEATKHYIEMTQSSATNDRGYNPLGDNIPFPGEENKDIIDSKLRLSDVINAIRAIDYKSNSWGI